MYHIDAVERQEQQQHYTTIYTLLLHPGGRWMARGKVIEQVRLKPELAAREAV